MLCLPLTLLMLCCTWPTVPKHVPHLLLVMCTCWLKVYWLHTLQIRSPTTVVMYFLHEATLNNVLLEIALCKVCARGHHIHIHVHVYTKQLTGVLQLMYWNSWLVWETTKVTAVCKWDYFGKRNNQQQQQKPCSLLVWLRSMFQVHSLTSVMPALILYVWYVCCRDGCSYIQWSLSTTESRLSQLGSRKVSIYPRAPVYFQ